MSQRLSIVIPTYGRNAVLCNTIEALLDLDCQASEIILMDQMPQHDMATERRLSEWQEDKKIRWTRLKKPSTTCAMNQGVLAATGDIVLFLDDDIIPDPHLFHNHLVAYDRYPEISAVVGRVLQPEDWCESAGVAQKKPRYRTNKASKVRAGQHLRTDLSFRFNGTEPTWISNVMAGNLSVRRHRFLEIGGFDENFGPPVAYRFETELAKRVIANGGKIWFEPKASIQHLRAPSGGTRSHGSHLTSASPIHGVGDYYYALRCGHGWERLLYMLRRPFREVRTKFHLHHPWYIPVKFIGELRAMAAAVRLYRRGARLVSMDHIDHLHNEQ